VNLLDAIGAVVDQLGDAQIEDLAARCERGASPSALAAAVPGAGPGGKDAVARLAAAWAAAGNRLTGPGLALALRIGLRERAHARERRAQPVWTGPGAAGSERLTASVLHELLCSAGERVLLVSYAAFTLKEIAVDLEAAVGRGCTVDVVFETDADSGGSYTGPDAPFGAVEGIRRWRWPADRRPATGAALHAKLLVVDRRRALIGSANLTYRALHDNLEAGVLISDRAVASALDEHVRTLMRTGTFDRI